MPRSQPQDRLGQETRNERLNSRMQLKKIASLVAEFLKSGLKPLSSAVVLSLAQRGLIPQQLSGTAAGRLIERLSVEVFSHDGAEVDFSELGNCLMKSAGSDDEDLIDARLLQSTDFSEADRIFDTLKSIRHSFLNPMINESIADALFCGWLYQSVLMGRTDYSTSRNQRSPETLSRITQWFTPEWITTFLLDECFRDNENGSKRDEQSTTFLDSSCGAGHILVPALRKLLARRLLASAAEITSTTREQRAELLLKTLDDAETIKRFTQQEIATHLSEILSSQLYGLDVDPLMVRLSGFSIYLSCRDLNRTAPLPIPALFSFCDRVDAQKRSALQEAASAIASSSRSSQGSLLLALDPRPEDVSLRRIDGSIIALSILPKTFDRQTLNPPYLSHRLMSDESAKFLKENFDGSQYDYYTAFLELTIRLMAPNGRLALICQQSFLSTSRFEDLRRRLIERCHISSIVQLGAGAFASRGGEKVSNAIIVLNLKGSEEAHPVSVYKLVSAQAKEEAECVGINEFVKQTFSEKELMAKSQMISGFPIVPFCPDEVALLFQQHPSIAESDSGIVLTNGLFTCDNKRFVRHFLEMSEHDRSNFVPYDKGGGQKWFSTTPYLLEWINNGDEIRSFRLQRGQSKALPGERFYFQRGITYSYIGTKGFKARLLSPGSVFDIASSAMFSEEIELHYMLGFLNSSLTRFILGMLNPTVNFQIGDLRRVPFSCPPKRIEHEVADLARAAVELAREAETFDRASPNYNLDITGVSAHAKVDSINQNELRIQNSIDEAIFDLYKITDTTRDIIKKNEWVARTQGDLINTNVELSRRH